MINGPGTEQGCSWNALFFETLFAAEIEQIDNERASATSPPRRRISLTVASIVRRLPADRPPPELCRPV